MEPDDLRGLGDVLLDREVGKDEVLSGLCSLFGLEPGQAIAVEADEEPGEQGTPELVFCCVHRLGGDFPILLSLSEGLSAALPRIAVASSLCRLLGCRCLVDDGSVNPYTFLLVDQGGQARQVAVDVVRWDSNEYVIDRDWPGR
jgi:hypothetical protein